MPKRRRLLNLPRKTSKVHNNKNEDIPDKFLDREVRTARGRLMGALLEVLEADESDNERYIPQHSKKDTSGEEDEEDQTNQPLPRQSYVLKLFDRSVDLSQFQEDSPLYPICRAWIQNQPKAKYSNHKKQPEATDVEELPGPKGPPISRIPALIPEQETRDKTNIKLDYRDAPLPSREELLTSHIARWSSVRRAWLQQAARVEARYADSQKVLEAKFTFNST